ncbi:2,3-diaminopropionate biosynthesis protein SbnA [Streptosporangium sp. NPDC051022]|uniref:2,3-diaminopropionate biosynthesis protein SbnA n=1 Tax=Streptosporangium sp. NPDC051022 TaxID=3155752 RepID=UPI00342B68B4
MLYDYPYDVGSEHHFLGLPGLLPGSETYLKLEGVNLAGSIKLKAALGMVEAAERSDRLRPDGHIIESSSGSLGVALALIAAVKRYTFTCVVDPHISRTSLAAIRAYGARVICVDQVDANGGYLQSRLETVQCCVEADPSIVWLNQYSNPANPAAHITGTAAGILDQFPRIDYLFVGVGTAGTFMGCVEHFRRHSPSTRVIAVDAVGSVTFGGEAQTRRIPGLGASKTPPLFKSGRAYRQIQVAETDTIRCCRMLAQSYGYLAGGSTGSIIAAVLAMRSTIEPGSLVVALSPDIGDRYVDTVYDDDWVRSRYGAEALEPMRADTEPRSHRGRVTHQRVYGGETTCASP